MLNIELDRDLIGTLLGENTSKVYQGRANFVHGGAAYSSNIIVYTNASKAYIEYNDTIEAFIQDGIVVFDGLVEEERPISGKIGPSKNYADGKTIAECFELSIGAATNVYKIEAVLMGCYIKHEFTFHYRGNKITFVPGTNTLSMANRTKRLNHIILEGNRVVIEHGNLSIDGVNQMLWVICWLLRPIVASEVYYKPLIINDGELIFYSPKTPSGKRFGMSEKILMSTATLPTYFQDGLIKWEKLDPFDKQTIKDAGHALANAEELGYSELAMMALLAAIERLGSKYGNAKAESTIGKIVKNLKDELKEKVNTFFDNTDGELSDDHKSNLLLSIGNIKPYDDQVVQKVKKHLVNNGFKTEPDFKIFKKLRDNLMHSGVWPKKSKKPPFNDPEDYPNQKSNELQDQLETIMLIAVLDLVGYDGLIAMSKNGWRTYVWVYDVKLGNVE
ncbi:MAG: hypothetical protein R2774_09235 [Saprospiraceae bacterium]